MRAKILVTWILSYLLGCFLAPFLPAISFLMPLCIAVFVTSFFFTARRFLFGLVFALAVFIFAISNFQSQATSYLKINNELSGKAGKLLLVVDDLPQPSLHGYKLRLRAANGMIINGYFNERPSLDFGTIIEAPVKLKAYSEENKYMLIRQRVVGESSVYNYVVVGKEGGADTWVRGFLLSIRARFNQSLATLLPAAEAGLASGIVMGEKALISPEMTRMLQASGTTHIIALSGYNITIILGLFIALRNRMSRLTNVLLPGTFIILFVVMTGASASLVRAAIMGMMPIVARFIGRESDSFVSILFSAFVMSIVNPFLPMYDIGFQLSFVAIAGVIYLSPILIRLFRTLGESLSATLSETVAAQVTTFPLISYYFGLVSVIAPVTNLIILGFLPVCMALVFIVGLLGLTVLPLAKIFAIPTYYLLYFINSVIGWSGSVSWASKAIKIENPLWILVLYLLIFDMWLYFHKVGPTGPPEQNPEG